MFRDEGADEDTDPLEDLYEDKDAYNRQQLANTLRGVISIDKETGGPIFKDGYQELKNKEKFVAQLLYRRAAHGLNELDDGELGANSNEFANNLGSSASAVQNYASELNFVENSDEYGGYHLQGYAIVEAVQFLQDTGSD